MKKYSEENDKGDTGEAIFQSIIRSHAIPHKIERSKDIGVDFLCEWKNGQEPTGVIFSAQVKYYPSCTASLIGKENLNSLQKYSILPTVSIDTETQDYWKLLGMPCYLFVIIPNGNSADLFYKRYTPILTGDKASQSESPFYKANDHLNFFAYADTQRRMGGFARDLYIDQMRSNYSKGMIAYLNPRRLGLDQFPDADSDVYFKDIFQEYKINLEDTFERLRSVLGDTNELQAIPSQPPPDDDSDLNSNQ
jgi:hypothetical protein